LSNFLGTVGTPLDDFDLLIGTTAIANNLIMVTHDTNHFKRLQGIRLEDWTKQA
jgi:tRNA(fMet)-specific endonuclease VapC